MAQKKNKKTEDEPLIIGSNFKHNNAVLYYLRTCASIISGTATGILGATGWLGIAYYFVGQFLCVLPLLMKAKGQYRRYFRSWYNIMFDDVFTSTGFLGHLVFWMIFYNLGYVF